MTTAFLEHDLIRDEGIAFKSYLDTKGNWTIGIGHKLTPDIANRATLVWSKDQIDAAFTQDVVTAQLGIGDSWALYKSQTDLRQDCLVNMAFNLGVHGLLKFTTFLDLLGKGRFPEAALDLRGTPWFHEVGQRAVRIAEQLITNTHQE